MVPESGHIILPKYQLSLARRHIIVQEHLIGPSKRAYYFTTTYNLFQQAGILFFPNYQLAHASGYIIFPNYQLAPASGHIFPTFNWLQKVSIFFQNIKLAPESRHIFPNQQLAPASGHIIFPQLSIGPIMRTYYFPLTLNCPQQAGI